METKNKSEQSSSQILLMQKNKLWTDSENQFLKKYYPTKGSKYIADSLGRTRTAVTTHAGKIGISGTGYLPYHPYSPAEIIFIKKYYPLYGSKYVGQRLGRSQSSIKDKARRLRVERKKFIDWNEYEIKYLKKWYKKKRASQIARHLERTTPAVVTRARMLGLLIRVTRKWNNDEELFLIKNFYKMTYKQIGKHLSRTAGSVGSKANTMLTMRKIKTRKWETKEKRLLSRLYGKISVAELAARLNRTTHSVLHQASVQKKTAKGAPAYTSEEINFIRDNYLKMTNVEIAKKLNRSASRISKIASSFALTDNPEKKRLWKRGIRKESGYNYSEKEKEFIRNNYLKMTNVHIAERLNRSVKGIETIAIKMGLTGNPKKIKLWQRGKRGDK
jgi:hypothetical protein